MTEKQNILPDVLEAGEMDAASAKLVEEINALLYASPLQEGDPMAQARKLASEMFTVFAGPDHFKGVRTQDITIPNSQRGIPARVYFHSECQADASPLIVFFHGGGWALGGLNEYDVFLKSISKQSGTNIISVDYRLAPEHPFPEGLEDAQTALEYLSSHAANFYGDPDRLAVMGDSAGGNLAAVLAQSPENKDRIAAQFLLYPMLDVFKPHSAYPSRQTYGDGAHFLTRTAIDKSVDDYTAGKLNLDNPRISPLLATSLSDIPPTYIIVGNCDPLKDEALAYATRLRQSGVDVSVECIPGAIHAFLSFGCMEDVQTYRTKLAQTIQRRLNVNN
jgi:acetyl esterase